MNIFLREMKTYRKPLIIWCFGMFLMVAGGMSKYAGLSTSGQSVNDIMMKMPKSLQSFFGTGILDLSKASGFYGLLFLYLVIMATVHAVIIGADIISKEEQDKTTEFLMAKPISRNRIITSKIIFAFVNILILNIVTMISSIIIVRYFSKGESVDHEILTLMVGMFILQLIYMFIGTSIASITKKPKSAASVSTAVLLVTFILSVIIDINNKLEILKYFTPFKYFDAKNLMSYGFEYSFLILSFVIIVILFVTTYVFYQKRDLNV